MDCEEVEMMKPRIHQGLVCIGIILLLSGCGVPSASEDSTTASTTTSSGAARVELTSYATSVDYDGNVILSWTTNRVQDCVALGDWSGDKKTSGAETIHSLVQTVLLNWPVPKSTMARTPGVPSQ